MDIITENVNSNFVKPLHMQVALLSLFHATRWHRN